MNDLAKSLLSAYGRDRTDTENLVDALLWLADYKQWESWELAELARELTKP